MIIRVKINDETYEVSISNLDERPIKAQIGDQSFEVWPEEEEAKPAESSRPAEGGIISPKSSTSMVNVEAGNVEKKTPTALRSPLPGVITQISINLGDTVKPGQEVMRLEAMKMSNLIRTTHSGTVYQIHVTNGQHVKHGDILITFN